VKFSISTPVYKQAHFIATAMQSLRVQKARFDLAVLDATPDDSVQQAISPYRDLIKYAYHRPDGGQAAAIAEGWTHTEGDIVAWLNADDYYFPNTLALVEDAFRRTPETDVVYGHAVFVTESGDFQMYFPAIDPDPAMVRRSCTICQPSCFVRRSALERIGGLDTGLHYTMDWDLWMRLYDAGCRFVFLDQVLSAVRIYSGIKTLSGSKRRYHEIDRLLRRHKGFFARWRGLLSFRVYDYLNQEHWSFPAWALVKAQRIKRHFAGEFRTSAREVRGLQCWTNRVATSCSIELPWFTRDPPRELRFATDRSTLFTAKVAGEMLPVEPVGPIRTGLQSPSALTHEYRIPLRGPATNPIVVELGAVSGPWQLNVLRLA
jgi:glycosyltransferase involved in cell wall biosynthesis